MAADGGDQIDVSDDPDVDDAPVWSPDGGSIAFVAYLHGADPFTIGQGDAEIFVVRSDGSHKVDVSRNHAWDGDPAWSPDGRSIAFTRRTDHARDLRHARGRQRPATPARRGRPRERLLPGLAPRLDPLLAPAEVPDARDQLVRGPPLVHALPPDEVGARAEQHDHGAVALGPGLEAALDPPPVGAAADQRGRRRRPTRPGRVRAAERPRAGTPRTNAARPSSSRAGARVRRPGGRRSSTAHSERRISATSRGSVISS